MFGGMRMPYYGRLFGVRVARALVRLEEVSGPSFDAAALVERLLATRPEQRLCAIEHVRLSVRLRAELPRLKERAVRAATRRNLLEQAVRRQARELADRRLSGRTRLQLVVGAAATRAALLRTVAEVERLKRTMAARRRRYYELSAQLGLAHADPDEALASRDKTKGNATVGRSG